MRTFALAALFACALAGSEFDETGKLVFKIHPNGTTSGMTGGVDPFDLRKRLQRHEDMYGPLRNKTSNASIEFTGSRPPKEGEHGKVHKGKTLGVDRCVEYNDVPDALCAQSAHYPTCPMTYKLAWYRCMMLATFLYSLDQVYTTAALTWYTNSNCTIHRTFCEVYHETHLDQYEDEIYDYTEVCDKVVQIQYSYSNQLHTDNSTAISITNGNLRLPLGEEEVIYTLRSAGELLHEEKVTIGLYERDTRGDLTYAFTEVTETTVNDNAPLGMWSQFFFVVTNYENGVASTQKLSPVDYHITPYTMLASCPSQWSWHKHHRGSGLSTAAIVLIVVVPLTVILVTSVLVHLYLAKRRQYYAERIIQAEQIQVVSASVIDPKDLHKCGSFVQGVPVTGVVVNEEKTAAPLPPQRSSGSSNYPRQAPNDE